VLFYERRSCSWPAKIVARLLRRGLRSERSILHRRRTAKAGKNRGILARACGRERKRERERIKGTAEARRDPRGRASGLTRVPDRSPIDRSRGINPALFTFTVSLCRRSYRRGSCNVYHRVIGMRRSLKIHTTAVGRDRPHWICGVAWKGTRKGSEPGEERRRERGEGGKETVNNSERGRGRRGEREEMDV